MTIQWWPRAVLALLNMPRTDAETIDRAVQRFAESGEGGVIFVNGEYLLFVGDRVVVMLLDGDTLHVDRVRKA